MLWHRPGRTIRELAGNGRGQAAAFMVAALLGAFFSLRLHLGSEGNPAALLLFLPVGSLGGMAGLVFLSMLVRNFGRWFGGHAELRTVRTAIGLGLLPWAILTALLNGALFSGLDASSATVLLPVFFLLFLYGYILLLLNTMAALGLAAFRATLTLAISLAVAFFFIATAARLFFR